MEGPSSDNVDFSKLNLPGSIAEFFSKEENENMCDFDKLHYKNIRLNYEMMLHFGLPARKPDFMKPNRGMPKKQAVESSSESDEDWRPRRKRKTGPKPWSAPYRPPAATVTSATAHNPSNAQPQKTAATLVKKTRHKAEQTEEEPRVYSLRKRKETNYMKLEVPNDDEFVYCEECNQEHEGDCPEHGPFLDVIDTPVAVKKRGDPQRALKTLPPGLEVKESGIPNAGLGVFATKFFPLRSRFGPYEGRRVKDPDVAHSSGYCWQILCDDRSSHFVDAQESKAANWMRYVNCARTRPEQNVTAYQHSGEVYYRAHTSIPPGTEILVWYGREYGKELGIIRDDDQPKRRKPNGRIEAEDDQTLDASFTFSDIRSSDIEFTDTDQDEEKKDKARQKRNGPTNVNRKASPGLHNTGKVASEKQKAAATSSLLSQDRPHVCQRCNAAFVQFSSLRIHMASAHGEKLLTVPRESCRSDGTVGNHGDRKGAHNKDTGRRHVCDVCNKAFSQASDLKRHKMIHTGEKPFVCDVCRKAFIEAGKLKIHKRIHTGEKPYKCPHCDAAFDDSGHLQRHIRMVHARDKPHVCDVCGAAFSLNFTLQTHIRTVHARDKPHVCDVCGAAFSVTYTLQTHKRTHTGEKPYVCNDCGKAFARSGILKGHRLTHTGEKPYKCQHCPSAFTTSGNLKRHVQSLHQ